jgi:hypothetical protein
MRCQGIRLALLNDPVAALPAWMSLILVLGLAYGPIAFRTGFKVRDRLPAARGPKQKTASPSLKADRPMYARVDYKTRSADVSVTPETAPVSS